MVAPAIIAGGLMAGGSVLGGLLGKRSADKAAKEQARLAREAANQFSGINVPTAEELMVQLQQLVSAGELTPEQAQSILIERSAFEDVNPYNQGTDAELAALEEMSNIVENKGLTAQDRAQIADIQEQMGTAGRGAREAILQDAAQRGIGGSGLELAALLGQQQGDIANANRQGLQTAAEAERRALEAIIAQGEMGSRFSSADFEKQARTAEAKDLISKFNAANRQNVELENVGSRNLAQERNLAERQRISDANIQQENQNRLRRSDLAQQEFENRLDLAKGKSAALTGAAQTAGERAKSQQQFYGNLIGAGGQLLGAVAPYMSSQNKKKYNPATGQYE